MALNQECQIQTQPTTSDNEEGESMARDTDANPKQEQQATSMQPPETA